MASSTDNFKNIADPLPAGAPDSWASLYPPSVPLPRRDPEGMTLSELEDRIRRRDAARPPISHARLIARDPDSISRLHAEIWVRRKQPDALLPVEHDRDGACCARESLEQTLSVLLEEVPRDGS